jgi:hypothetical protein
MPSFTCFGGRRQGMQEKPSALHRASTDRKSPLALRGVGPESEAESVRFHRRRVTKVGPGSHRDGVL